MPTYKRIFATPVYLPDVNVTADLGDVVDLPEGFFGDDAQAQAAGFAPVAEPASVVADAERPAPEPQIVDSPVVEAAPPAPVAEPVVEPEVVPAPEPAAPVVEPTAVQE